MSLPPVILLGLDTAVGLVAMRELGRRGVPVVGVGYHAQAVGRGSRYLTQFTLRPDGPVSRWLPQLVSEHRAGAVLPLRDRDIVDVGALGNVQGVTSDETGNIYLSVQTDLKAKRGTILRLKRRRA